MDEGLNYLQSFNPIGSKPELLEHTLIGRKDLVDKLTELVIESAESGNKHQRLIIGPRGSGKTHVLKVLHNRIFNMDKLKDKLEMAYLCEDEYGIPTFLDWIIRILKSFIRWYPEKANYLENEIDKLKKVPVDDRERIAVRILLNYIQGKTLLIIVENIGNIFEKGFGKKGQQKFRDLLQQHPYFTIMASNQVLFKDIQREDMPFHNFFKIIHLWKLSIEETIIFLKSIAEWDKNSDLLKFFDTPEGIGQIKTIYDFVGGNHRLLVIFYQFLKIELKNKLSESFIKTINDLIPYYQNIMNILSAQQQKVIQYLSQNRKPSNVKNISENCFSAQNIISKQMINLKRLKYVDATSSGRETFYELSEPLLRICNEVKENRGGPIKLFVDFLGNLYTVEEIKRRYKYYHILSKVTEEKTSIAFYEEQFSVDLAKLLMKENRDEEAQTYIDKALKESPTDSYLLNNIGEIYRETNQFENAIPLYRQAIEINPKNVWAHFYIVFCKLGLDSILEALSQLEQALKIAVETQSVDLLIQCFEENHTTLFIHASQENIPKYLNEALVLIGKYNYTEQLLKSMPETLFDILKQHDKIDTDRFEYIENYLNEKFKDEESMIVPLKFLNIGIRHLKKQEKNVLMQFTKEERATFKKFVLDRIKNHKSKVEE